MNAKQPMVYKLTVLVAILIVLCVNSCTNIGAQAQADRLAGYEVSGLQILTQDGRRLQFTVYLATTKPQRMQGLSFVTDLPLDHGMLFVFPKPQRINMWMKDTPNSLDLLFIDRQGVILQIVNEATPNTTEIIASEGDAYAVLELNAGIAQRLSINPGDVVYHPLLSEAETKPATSMN
ncbi:DUF192 domain-containing protein [Kaarinaea lacus]